MKQKVKATKKYFAKLGLDPDILKGIKDATIKRMSIDQKMELPEEEEGSVAGVITDVTIDADGDVILPEGLEFKRYQLNPIVLFNHDMDDPIGYVDDLSRSDASVHARVKFGTTEQPRRILQLCRDRVLRTFSLGFLTLEELRRGQPGFNVGLKKLMEDFPLKINSENAGTVQRIVVKSMMVELSVVTIPSNMHAVITEVKKLKTETNLDPVGKTQGAGKITEKKAEPNLDPIGKTQGKEKIVEKKSIEIKKVGRAAHSIKKVSSMEAVRQKQLSEIFLKNWGC